MDNEVINNDGSIKDDFIDGQEKKILLKSEKELNKYFNTKVIAIYLLFFIYYSFTFSTLFNTTSFF